jgi:hypothetical protein
MFKKLIEVKELDALPTAEHQTGGSAFLAGHEDCNMRVSVL